MARSWVLVAATLLASAVRAEDVPAPLAAVTPATVTPATATPAATPAEKPLLIGLERTLSEDIARTEGRGVAGYLSAALKQPVKARIFKNYDDLADALGQGEIDLAWINPFSFVRASQASAVFPVAKALRKGSTYHSVFFVKAESPAKALADLKGLKVAWVDPGSAAGYLYPQGVLLKANLSPKQYFSSETFAGTHKAVCEAVLAGTADVGATFHTGDDLSDLRPDGCTETLGPDVGPKLRGVVASDAIPTEVIAARAGLDEALAGKLTGLFAGMSDTEAGKSMLKTVFRADGFGFPFDSDFDGIKAVARSVAAGQWITAKQDVVEAPSKARAKAKAKAKARSTKPAPPTARLRPHSGD
jgi:phosphonate transport system substrate-binding protein